MTHGLAARIHGIALFAALSFGMVLGPVAHAAPPAAPAPRPAATQPAPANDAQTGKVDVSVKVVYANNSGKVDPALASLERQLAFTRYTGLELLSTHEAGLAIGGDETFAIAGGRKLRLDLLEKTATEAKIRIRILKDGQNVVDTTLTIKRGKTMTFAGPKYMDGALVIPVTVTY